ncbi:MAG: PEGA domain-containing protein [Polyangiales bacterium]
MAKRTYLLVACVLLLPAFGVRADAASEARARYERAVKLYEDGVYDAALAELTRAYELNPSYKVLFNIGQVRVALQDYAGAVDTFQTYLREGGGNIPQQRSEQVRKELARIEQRVARIGVETDVQGAEVLVDDVVVGTAPLANALLVNSGTRRVAVRHPDYQVQTQRVTLAGGEQRTLSLWLKPRDVAPVAAPLPPVVEAPKPLLATPTPLPPPKSNRTLLLSSVWGTTGALAVTTTLLGVFALRADGDLEDLRGEATTRPALEDQADKVDRLALATDVMLGATAVAAGVSLWLTLRPQREQRVAFTGRGLGYRTEF